MAYVRSGQANVWWDSQGEGTVPGPYSMSMLSEAVVALIRASGGPAVHVLGISLGGLIAQDLTLNHPELVTSLTLVSTHAGIPHASSDPGVMEALLPFAHAPSMPAERLAEDCAVRAKHPTSEEGYRNQLIGVSTWERLGDLPTIDRPTLVLRGQLDRVVLVEGAQLLAKQIRGARLTVLPDCGHQLFTDQPEAGSRTVREFLGGVDSASDWSKQIEF